MFAFFHIMGLIKKEVSIFCQLRCRRSNDRKLTKVLNKSTRIYAYSHFRKEESLPWFQNQNEAKAILKSSLFSCTSGRKPFYRLHNRYRTLFPYKPGSRPSFLSHSQRSRIQKFGLFQGPQKILRASEAGKKK